MRRLLVVATVLALATPLPAVAVQVENGYQVLENFEDIPLGPASFQYFGGELGILSGGEVITATADFPAVSGTQVYAGQNLVFNIANKVDFTWPAIGATISGPAVVTMTVYGFNSDLFEEFEVGSLATLGGINETLFFGDEFNPLGVTRATFTSSQPFAIDNFIVGLPDVGPGIPEPVTWALLVTGFGLTGAAMRSRRRFA